MLYIANRWDPRIQDEYSGNDYGAYHAIKNQPNVEVELVGPFNFPPEILDRIYYKFPRLFKKRPIKHSISYLKKSAKIVEDAVKRFQPDVIFSKYSAPLVYVDLKIPFVYMCDSTIIWARETAKEYSSFTYDRMEKWEEKIIRMATKVITYSQANAEVITEAYGKSPNDIIVFPIPSQVPKKLIPDRNSISKHFGKRLNLLFVGKRFHLRGADIAIEVVKQLNKNGVPADLRIVGMDENDTKFVNFKGAFHKEQPGEIEAYFENYKWADILLHPARFHSAGIVISEAAAFGVPTVTNNVGGLATTVKDGITGFVLPAKSSPEAYVKKIKSLMKNEDIYQVMQLSARSRFDEELHWDVAGKILFKCIQSIVKE